MKNAAPPDRALQLDQFSWPDYYLTRRTPAHVQLQPKRVATRYKGKLTAPPVWDLADLLPIDEQSNWPHDTMEITGAGYCNTGMNKSLVLIHELLNLEG
jgi:hypothetical protein